MSEKDTIIRQRLIELERKHAKALRKLQRAEKSKQRRQTFHGYTVKDENIDSSDAQNRSSVSLSQEVFTPDDRKSSSPSAHKKGLCNKSVTFKDAVDTDQQPLLEKRCNESEGSASYKEKSRRRSAPTESCIPEIEPEGDIKMSQGDIDSDSNDFVAADKNWVESSSNSLLLSDKERILDNEVIAEHKDCSRTLDDHDQTVKNAEFVGYSALDKDVLIIPTCNKEQSDSFCFTNNEREFTAKEIENPSIENIAKENRHSSDHTCNSVDAFTKEGLGSPNEDVDVKVEKEDSGSCSSLRGSDNLPSENCRWLQLFEEEFPRRSPRLRSTPNFGCQAVVSQDNNNVMQSRGKKSARSKQKSRTKKEITSCGRDKKIKCNMEDTTLCDNLPDERTSKDLVFPRPSSEQTKNGGSLSVVVDFSLPDKDFAKLKLAKIKGALPVERINRVVNGKSEKTIGEHASMVNGHNILSEAKCEEEIKEGCSCPLIEPASSLLACPVQFVSESKQCHGSERSREVETFVAANTLEQNRIKKVERGDNSLSVALECNESCADNSSFSFNHQQLDLQLKNVPQEHMVTEEGMVTQQVMVTQQDMVAQEHMVTQEHIVTQEHMVAQTPALSQVDAESCHNYTNVETGGVTGLTCDIQQTNGIENKHKLCPDDCEQPELCDEHDTPDNQSGSNYDERLLDNNVPLECASEGPQKVNELSNESNNHQCPKTYDRQETCCATFPTADKGIWKSPEQQYNQRELFNSSQGKSSLFNPEPSIGDQATPHGKMKEPLESSQFSCMVSPEDRSELSPVLMMACFQHHVEGENNKVRGVSMSSYEPSTEKDVTLLKNKRDVLAVCLAHLVVIWTVVPGLQWTVLHKWTLPTDGAEEFMSVQVVPMNSHVVLLVGGNFYGGNGRILGYSEEGDYSFNLKHDDKRSEKASFSTMCLLHDTTVEKNIDVDVEFVIGNRTSHKVMLTKWTLDSFCLLVEQQQSFTPITTDSDLLSLQAVRGSHCLLLGTTDDKLFLWNHKTCQQLRSICLHTMGLGQLSCLKAFTDRGLLFLMMASKSGEGFNCGTSNTDGCLLFALNPKTFKMLCLECFCRAERLNIVGTNGQYIAAGHQARGEVNIWNVTNNQRHATLQVFQDEVSSIGFHQDRPVIAFGSTSGCVHLFSLC